MALIPCPECQREVSTAAAACPQCGYPLQASSSTETPVYIGFDEPKRRSRQRDYADDYHGGQACYACHASADRACTRCGRMCCGEHSTWFHPIKHAGLVCSSCASTHWIISLVGIAVVGVIILLVMMGGFR